MSTSIELGLRQRCAMAEHALHALVGEAGLSHLMPLFEEAQRSKALDLGRLATVAPTVQRIALAGAADERRKIAAFLRAEAERFTAEAKALWAKVEANNTRHDRLTTEARHDRDEWVRVASKASMARTLAAYVARGDHEMPAARGDV